MKKYMRCLSILLIFSFLMLALHIPEAAMAGTNKKQKPRQGIPPVKIIAPQDGCSIQQGERLELMVQIKPGLKAVSVTFLYIDGKGIGMADKSPYSYTWDTTGIKPGPYSIKAQAHLADGRIFESAPVEIFIEGQPAPPEPAGTIIKEGTPIILKTEEEMISGRIPKDTVIHFRVDKDVIGSEGQVIIPYDAIGYGKVLESRSHGMFGRPGKLNFALESVTAADGTSVPLRAIRDATANDAGALVVVGALFLSVLFVFFCGNNIEIPKGTLFTAYVNHDTLIAKPLAPKMTSVDMEITRTVIIDNPAQGVSIKKSGEYTFSCKISPADDTAFVRIYLDDDLIAWQKGNLSNIKWKNAKTGNMKAGEHVLFAEVTFTSGHIVKSPPVKFSVE